MTTTHLVKKVNNPKDGLMKIYTYCSKNNGSFDYKDTFSIPDDKYPDDRFSYNVQLIDCDECLQKVGMRELAKLE